MTRRELDRESPGRLYTLTGGRAGSDAFDLVTLIVSQSEPEPGMQSEHARILAFCARPTAVVEVAAELRLPVSVVKVLLGDLLAMNRIAVRQPAAPAGQPAGQETLRQVLVALHKL